MRVKPLFAVFLTILFDTLSFSVVFPDLQTRVYRLAPGPPAWLVDINPAVFAGFVTGLILALYSIAQFFVAPFLGALSDRTGRRIVLIWTSWLSVASALLYVFATSLPVIAVSRILFGCAAANVGVATAYISDNSTQEDRAKSMGVLGMAFGTGFIIGPPTGAFLMKLGGGSPVLIGVFSTVFALVNVCFVTFFLPEAPRAETAPKAKQNRIELLKKAMSPPALRMLLLAFFAFQMAFTNLESTYFLLGQIVYKVDAGWVASVLVLVGVVQFGTQGGLVRILIPRFGERRMMTMGYIITCPAMFTVPLVPFGPLVYLGALFLGLGSGIATPSINSLISREAPREIVGEVFGVAASLGALARIFGPPLANSLFRLSPKYPYFLATGLIGVAVVFALMYRPSVRPVLETAGAEA